MKSKKNHHSIVGLIFIASALLLTGCATTKSLYGWNDYQPEVYKYLQGNNVEEQIITLEKNLEQFKARGESAPPGFHAHLGMLYAQVGKMDQAAQEFNIEKRLFPESAPYMNFLLNKKDSPKTTSEKPIDDGKKKVAPKDQTGVATPVSSNQSKKKEQ